ncbi:MAG: GNAT family N-acetyltransferase [Acidobacteria bacterium]|nr:GNAT family N-acetyltransferase [Acidobacteriota bacterium]
MLKLRAATADDRSEIADLIYASINTWYRLHGMPQIFHGGPAVTGIFYDVYERVDPGCCVVAENESTGRLMGSCFYHPRKLHVGLGIMNVHPNYFGLGVGRELLRYITDFTDHHGYKSLRLTQSALNLDSFSLYNRAGFVPRHAYQDMMLTVPAAGLPHRVPGMDRVRDATLADIPAIAALEMSVSGVTREQDYRLAIENPHGFWSASVYEGSGGAIDGFLISCGHAAMNMVGPGVMRSDEHAAALILREYDRHRGRSPVCLIPVERAGLVRQMYEWGARNVELHFCQVRGKFQPFAGVNMPMFLMETA